MKVLLVDDLPAIVESLKNGIDWKKAGVEKVYTACSAREAKLVLTNFPIDVLLCDIEMPEENGLELVRWAKEHIETLECVFLTAHAEFDYVKEALHLGSFDYILQPVKFEDVESVLEKVKNRIEENRRHRKLETITQKAVNQGNNLLEVMLSKNAQGNEAAANQICRDYMELCSCLYEDCVVYQALISIVRWERITHIRKAAEVRTILENTFYSLFDEDAVKLAVASAGKDRYWSLLFADRMSVTGEVWEQKITEFYEFIDKNMDFTLAIYPCKEPADSDFISVYRLLEKRESENSTKQAGIFIDRKNSKCGRAMNPVIEEALLYINNNMNKNVSRTEVAGKVNLSEEYFSRLFRQETGDTFKDYILMMKMEAAKELLRDTRLSVSIIASKVGYSNFSHFSQMFKNYSGMTPQEFRKNVQNE